MPSRSPADGPSGTATPQAFKTAPAATTTGMPPGVPFIVGNEAAERFSFYGMKAILVFFMTQHLLTSTGQPAGMTETEAKEWYHLFVGSAYFFPILGGIIADAFLGKYLTILLLSLVYCAGHLCLALMDMPSSLLQATLEPRGWLMAGLALVAIGAGGIKPCVSAHVGDQFGPANKHLLERVFGWFYFSINFGSFFSTLLTPWLLEHHGPGWAFGVPGILMAVATLVFWLGRNRFVHIPPRGPAYFAEAFGPDGLRAILKLVPLYLLVAMFWALYDQTGSAWVQQAQQMDRRLMGVHWLVSQIQAINPLLVLLFIPLFSLVIYPMVGRVLTLTPLRKILVGFILTVLTFCISAFSQRLIDAEAVRFGGELATVASTIDRKASAQAIREAGMPALAESVDLDGSDIAPMTAAGIAVTSDGRKLEAKWPSVGWQVFAYVILTAAEILVSITSLEFSYTQAPPHMKSLVMSIYLLAVSLGNFFAAFVNSFTKDAQGNSTLTGENYYWFFAGCMAIATLLLVPVLVLYKPREYIQGEETAPTH
jgi:POT family proton-dependent oligopeptide transporter